MKNESLRNYEKFDALNNAVVKALHKLYDSDRDLINCNQFQDLKTVQKHVAERAVAFRFGVYFQEFCKVNKNISIDMEYNRHICDPKLMKCKDGSEKGIVPDLIVHERRCDRNNLLVVEFKGWWCTNRTQDREKLRSLTNPDEAYRYRYGMLITFEKSLDETKKNIEFYRAGKRDKSFLLC